jgi:hypothetical protein
MIFLPIFCVAQKIVKIPSNIEKVTVYFSGAQVIRTAKVNIYQGKNEFIFTGLSPLLNVESIQVSSSHNLDFSIIKHQFSSQSEPSIQTEINLLNQQKISILDKIDTEKQNLKVFQREEEMLLKNQVVGGSYSGLKPSDLKEMVEYQRNRMLEILKKQLDIERTIRDIEKELQKINQKLTEISSNFNKTFSEVSVLINSKTSISDCEITIAYVVNDAGWKPSYNLKVKSVSEPIDLLYKSSIYQYSGEDWKNVKLELSNSNLKKTGNAPTLKPWTWGMQNDYSEYFNGNILTNKTITSVSGIVTDASDNSPLSGVMVQLKGTGLGVSTDVNGFYQINIPPNLQNSKQTLSYSFVGYLPKEEIINTSKMNVSLKADTKTLEEVVVVGYGTQKKTSIVGATTRINNEKGKEIKRLVIDSETPLTQNYELIERFTILSDGKEVSAELKEVQIPAEYEFVSVPKIETEAFLNARVIDWEQYGLLNGELNLFFEGTFLGKSKLNLTNNDTLNISLGRDKNILIKREKLKQYSKTQLIGNKKIDSFSYEISVKNLKKQAINIIIEDQIPLSNNKEVEVIDKEANQAEFNSQTGKVSWRLNIEPSKEKKITLKYSVRYPKSGYIEVE